MPHTSLTECFDCQAGSQSCRVIALTGGGGKTSLMYALAKEFAADGQRVITTTTTKILPPYKNQAPHLLLMSDDPQLSRLDTVLGEFGHVVVGRYIIESNGKIQGIDDKELQSCVRIADRVIVEADGAAGRPLKAPEEWEPVIPSMTDLVIPVIGLDCLGKPATDEWVFRLERFLALTGLKKSEPVTAEALARLLVHPAGALKGVDINSRVIPFLNKQDVLQDESAIDEIAATIEAASQDRIRRLVYGSTKRLKWNRKELSQ